MMQVVTTMSAMKLHDQPLQFDAEQTRQIDRCLLHLADHVASPLVMLADVSGRLVLYRGRVTSTQCISLAALAAGSFAAAREIGTFLGMRDSFQQQLLEGRLANLYLLAVGAELLLVVAFTQQAMLGMVRLYAQDAQRELLALAQSAMIAREKGMYETKREVEAGFGEAVRKQLDEMFS